MRDVVMRHIPHARGCHAAAGDRLARKLIV
jgi:hypothetical protein